MTSVLLIYPYFKPKHDRSIFRFPPLGIIYLGASLRKAGYEVKTLDCTFAERNDALDEALHSGVDVAGIYSMASMKSDSLMFARLLRDKCGLIIAGGPLPTCDPASFMQDFDIVVTGEGEITTLDVLQAYEGGHGWDSVPGIVYRNGNGLRHSNNGDGLVFTGRRPHVADLDSIAFPARDLLPNNRYLDHWKKKSLVATTSIMTTRGCPFTCEFCSNAVFGVSYRERSAENVIDEVEQVLSCGYERVHFADDVFTLRKERVMQVCKEIIKRGLRFRWECLGRVDSIDRELAGAMREAGCDRIFFGIESADDSVLRLMNKKITVAAARRAVEAARYAGIKTGAFFILCYPGETDDTVLNTIRFSTSLPLDYLSFTMPYPLPGTVLYERVKRRGVSRELKARHNLISDHSLIFDADFSEFKMRFAVLKGQIQFWLRKRLRKYAFLMVRPFEAVTDTLFRLLK